MFFKSGKFFNIPNKFWEIQVEYWKDSGSYFDINLSWTTKTDHAGFRFHFEVFGLYFGIDIYDSRHWDTEKKDWETVPKQESV